MLLLLGVTDILSELAKAELFRAMLTFLDILVFDISDIFIFAFLTLVPFVSSRGLKVINLKSSVKLIHYNIINSLHSFDRKSLCLLRTPKNAKQKLFFPCSFLSAFR